MATHNLTNYNDMLKDWYVDDKVKELSYGENPFWAMVKKAHGQMAGGKRYVQPIEVEHPGGASGEFTEAMTNNTASVYDAFLLSRQPQYQRVLVDYELLAATKQKREAFEKAMDQFDRGFRGFGAKLGRRLFRTQGGSIGRLNGAVTGTTLTFEEKSQLFNLQIGMKVQFSTTDGTGSLLDGGDFVTITAIDHEGGTATVDNDLDGTISGITTTSYVFQKGDYALGVNGLEDWLPVADRDTKLATSFNSVNRLVNEAMLGGVYLDGTGMSLDEVLIKLVGKVGKYGGNTTHIFANPESLSDMQLLASGKLQAQAMESELRSATGDVLVGFSGFKAVIGPKTVRIFGDRHCPSDRVYALDMSTWTYWHAGEVVNWLGEEITGNKLQPAQNEPSAEARLGNWSNLGCNAPGHNGVAKIIASAN